MIEFDKSLSSIADIADEIEDIGFTTKIQSVVEHVSAARARTQSDSLSLIEKNRVSKKKHMIKLTCKLRYTGKRNKNVKSVVKKSVMKMLTQLPGVIDVHMDDEGVGGGSRGSWMSLEVHFNKLFVMPAAIMDALYGKKLDAQHVKFVRLYMDATDVC